MLSEAERLEIEAELRYYDHKRAACVEALKIVQRHRGWVTDESVQDLAECLEMSPDEVDGVATFYSLVFRRPVGRHTILICDSVSCWIMGYEDLRRHLAAHLGIDLGGTTADGRFTLLPVACLGTCDHAPAMMVDEELYQDLNKERIDQILGAYE
jgi:NADH-quinone oxidoreductase subunit E